MTEPESAPPLPANSPAPANPPVAVRWKKPLALITGLLLAAVIVYSLVRLVRPPPPTPQQRFLPLRILGAAAPQEGSGAPPHALTGAVVTSESCDRKNQAVGSPRDIITDMMGAANIPYTPDLMLHLRITAPQFAERELWLENPRQLALDTPEFTLTLDRTAGGPRSLPLFLTQPVPPDAPPDTPLIPIAGAAVSLQYDNADPQHLESPNDLTTNTEGMVTLKFLPGRGATVRIALPGYAPFAEHYLDSYDYERRRPSAIVELTPAPVPAAAPVPAPAQP